MPYSLLALSPIELNSGCRSEETYWGHQEFSQGKETNVILPQRDYGGYLRPTGCSSSHFGATVPHGMPRD